MRPGTPAAGPTVVPRSKQVTTAFPWDRPLTAQGGSAACPQACSWGCPPGSPLGLPLTFPLLGSLSLDCVSGAQMSPLLSSGCRLHFYLFLPSLHWGRFHGREGDCPVHRAHSGQESRPTLREMLNAEGRREQRRPRPEATGAIGNTH